MIGLGVGRGYLLEIVAGQLFDGNKLRQVAGISTLQSVERLVIAHVASQGLEVTNVSSQCVDHEKRSTPGATLKADQRVHLGHIALINHLDQVANGGLAEKGGD